MSGDFNVDLSERHSAESKRFINFLSETWNLQLNNNPSKCTTRNGTCVDAVFSRYVDNLHTEEFVSYFSHHRPLISVTSTSATTDTSTENISDSSVKIVELASGNVKKKIKIVQFIKYTFVFYFAMYKTIVLN